MVTVWFEVTQKHELSTIGNCTDTWLSKCTCDKYQTCLNFCSKCCPCARMQAQRCVCNCLTVSSLNSSFLLTVRFHPLLCFLSMVTSVSVFCNNLFKCLWLAGKFCDEFLALYPFSSPSTLITTWSFAENTEFLFIWLCQNIVTDML